MKQINNLKYLKQIRKELRNNMTHAEAILWKNLQGKKLEGKKFRRQHSVGNFVLDFYCPKEKLAIELDGNSHDLNYQYDFERDSWLNNVGIKVIRFENKEILEHIEAVLEEIKSNFKTYTTPTPPQKGGEMLGAIPKNSKETSAFVRKKRVKYNKIQKGNNTLLSEKKDKHSNMLPSLLRRGRGWLLLPIFIFLIFQSVNLFAQTYPVSVNSILQQPTPIFYHDYFDPGSNKWQVQFTFNDFNEPSWKVMLRLTIESNNVKIQTTQNYKLGTINPITVHPGVPNILSGDQLQPYLSYNHITVQGMTLQQLQQLGRLPEGFYTFCAEVLDYNSGKIISNSSCSNAYLKLYDEPLALLPTCGTVIPPTLPLNLLFQWQWQNPPPTSVQQQTYYKMYIYEITDPQVQPLQAINNNKALKIFESDILNTTSLYYGPAQPILDIGKRYVWFIQAIDQTGKDHFKNQGKSQACWFSYGYPEGGKIVLEQPVHNGSFTKNSQQYFKWKAPNNLTSGQQVYYKVKIVEVADGQDSVDAIQQNQAWYTTTTNVNNKSFWSIVINQPFEAQKHYAWQVSAYSENQQVAKSTIQCFYGPPLLEKFIVNVKHEVKVITAFGDLNNLSGTGEYVLKLQDTTIKVPLTFKNLKINCVGNYCFLTEGEIIQNLTNLSPLELEPDYTDNQKAYFNIEAMKLNAQNGLSLKGNIEWKLPLATMNDKKKVKTKSKWCDYDKNKLIAAVALSSIQAFDLLDPFGFNIEFNSNSIIQVLNGKYQLDLTGKIFFPEKVKTKNEDRASIYFSNWNQLYYNHLTCPPTGGSSNQQINSLTNQPLQPISNLNLCVHPKSIIIDFSDNTSPGINQSNGFWKGVYIEKSDIILEKGKDAGSGQLEITENIIIPFSPGGNNTAFIDAKGLTWKLEIGNQKLENIQLNTFKSELSGISLKVENNVLKEGNLIGRISIPFLSSKNKFSFTVPVANNGLLDGYLDETILGKSFILNANDAEQKVELTLQKAVFANKNRINLTTDISWPALDIHLTSVDGLRLWGDYSIGFVKVNGTISLQQQVQGNVSGFPVMFDYIGAGRQGNKYAIGLSGKIVMADDVSGENGPPSVNFYSIATNTLLDTNYIYITGDGGNGSTNYEVGGTNINSDAQELDETNDLLASFDVEAEKIKQKLDESKSTVGKVIEGIKGGIENSDSETSLSEEIIPDNTKKDTSYAEIKVSGIKEFIQEKKVYFIESIGKTIDKKVFDLNAHIEKKVNTKLDTLSIKIATSIDAVVMALAERAIQISKNDNIELESVIHSYSEIISKELSVEITNSIKESSKSNILSPLNQYIAVRLKDIIGNFVGQQIEKIASKAENENNDAILSSDDAFENQTSFLVFVKDEFLKTNIDFQKLYNTLTKTAEDAFDNINFENVYQKILLQITTSALTGLKQDLQDKADNLKDKVLGENFPDIGVGIKLNFDDIKEKGLKGIQPDAVAIKVNTKVASFAGYIQYTPDDAFFGNVWRGDIACSFTAPTPFSMAAIYVNGIKNGTKFWFVQVSPSGDTKVGGTIEKKAQPLENPVAMGPVKLAGFSGRVFHYMKEDESTGVVLPDASNKYGAYANVVFFDTKNNGMMYRMGAAATINVSEGNGYVVDFKGDLQIKNTTVSVTEIDVNSFAAGGLDIYYNSAEMHFLGHGWIKVNQPGTLCAEGHVNFETKPGYWFVGVGSKEQKLVFVPGCQGWSPTGWLGIDNSKADLGLGVSFTINAGVNLDLKVVEVGIVVNAGFAAGIQAVIQHTPTIILEKAGIWAEIWAAVMLNYKTALSSGSISLVDIYCSGNLVMTFVPKPTTIDGDINGHVSVLNGIINCDFNAHMNKTL